MKQLSKKDINNLLKGDSWFATGGGFPSDRAKEIFTQILKKRQLFLKGLEEFRDDDCLCVASGVGSVSKTSKDISKDSTKVIRILEEITKTNIKGIVSGEIGLECLAADAAIKLGLPLVDADMKGGRAAPEPPINLFNLDGANVTPMIVVNTDGDIAILKETSDPKNIETFLRHFANMASGAFVAWCPRTAFEYKKRLINKTISRTIKLGELINCGKNLDELLTHVSGKVIFKGKITGLRDENNKGFLMRRLTIMHNDSVCQVWVKNENLAVSVNDKIMVTCPDLITIINPENLQGIHNSKLKIGKKVIVIAIPNSKKWHSRRGYEIFGPKHFNLPFTVKKI